MFALVVSEHAETWEKYQDEEESELDRMEDRRGLEGWQLAGSYDSVSEKHRGYSHLTPSYTLTLKYPSWIFHVFEHLLRGVWCDCEGCGS